MLSRWRQRRGLRLGFSGGLGPCMGQLSYRSWCAILMRTFCRRGPQPPPLWSLLWQRPLHSLTSPPLKVRSMPDVALIVVHVEAPHRVSCYPQDEDGVVLLPAGSTKKHIAVQMLTEVRGRIQSMLLLRDKGITALITALDGLLPPLVAAGESSYSGEHQL
jgi:hypothetical protein